ncbi:MAG: class I SAM-dependent methyltransferase [Pseudomonadota bacterium]
MIDRKTIDVYDKNIEAYVKLTKRAEPDAALLAFMKRVAPDGLVLDLGCGPATSAATMRDHGFRVDPVDASPEMVKLANDTYDIGARVAHFGELVETDHYDGVWANFSLLHAQPQDLPEHLQAIHQALVPGGVFHIGMKLGEGARRDRLDRFYAYYSQADLTAYLTAAGFRVEDGATGEEMGLAGDIEPWITLLAVA